MLQGLLLGLANGTSCLAYCAPVFLPYLLGEGTTVRRSTSLLLQFLAGRLAGYLLFGILAWQAGRWIHQSDPRGLFMGIAYSVLAVILMIYGFGNPHGRCAAEVSSRQLPWLAKHYPSILPPLIGLATGMSLCPPFLVAITDASSKASMAASVAFFAAFFVGTSLFLVPLPLAGLFGKYNAVRIVGRLAAGITGFFYLYKGILLIYGGLIS